VDRSRAIGNYHNLAGTKIILEKCGVYTWFATFYHHK